MHRWSSGEVVRGATVRAEQGTKATGDRIDGVAFRRRRPRNSDEAVR